MQPRIEILTGLYNELLTLQGAGKDNEVRAFMENRFTQLPEDVQGELLARLYLQSLATRIAGEDAVAETQVKGLAMLDALEVLKKKIEEGGVQ